MDNDKKGKTTTKPTTFFGLFKDGYVARDGMGHRGEGNTPEEANERLKAAQELGVEWTKPLGSGPKVDGTASRPDEGVSSEANDLPARKGRTSNRGSSRAYDSHSSSGSTRSDASGFGIIAKLFILCIAVYFFYEMIFVWPMESRYKSLINQAETFATSGQYSKAEATFSNAYNISKKIGGSYPKELLELRSKYYEVGIAKPGDSYGYQVRGAFRLKVDFSFSRQSPLERCIYSYIVQDSRRIISSNDDVIINFPSGKTRSFKNGILVSDIVPNGSKICLSSTNDIHRRTIFFKSRDGEKATIFFVN